jgi:uncharacterized protein YbaP (TraB family)
LTAATYDQFMAAASDSGVPLAMFDELKPALAAIMLVAIEVEKLGFEPELGLDKHFYDLAKKAAKEVVPLETVEHQLNLVTDFSKEEGELLMKSTLKELETTRKSFTDIFKAWRMGDEQAMEKLLNGASREAPAIFKRLVTDRNANWVPKIEEFARGARPAIVIVGAGHLVGKDSVVDLLRKKGMEVRQK